MSAVVHQRMTGTIAGLNTVTFAADAEGEPNDLPPAFLVFQRFEDVQRWPEFKRQPPFAADFIL